MRRLLPLLLLGVVSCSGVKTEDDIDIGPVAPFSLKERDGRTITNDDLQGKVWVASFIFTRCSGPCPQVTGTVARLQSELKDRDDVRFVTFTVDPERDNPEELKQYADRFQADPTRWLFLTGKKEEIHDLLQQSFKVGVAEAPADMKKPGEEFSHSTRLVVVDRHGHIRGYFDGLPDPNDEDRKAFEANLTRLRKRVIALLGERRR
jgi:cytochrome oxidase Cu insertion factor (SCO1/SenC/PrrC family)